MTDVLWACRSSMKTATGFSLFSLVYGTEAISPMELVVPTLGLVLEENQEGTKDTNNERRLADLEGLEKKEKWPEEEEAKGTSKGWLRHMHRLHTHRLSLRCSWC